MRKFRAYKMTDKQLEDAKIRVTMAMYPPRESFLLKIGSFLFMIIYELGKKR